MKTTTEILALIDSQLLRTRHNLDLLQSLRDRIAAEPKAKAIPAVKAKLNRCRK